MATPSVLAFDADGRAIDFDVWVDDPQLFLQCDRADGLSLFDLTSGASPAPAADADATVRSQWATRDAAARLVVRRHLPTAERAHFSQCKSARTLYDAVVARYSSPATAALSRLILPYLFPDLAAFPTVADLITHLRTSDIRYRAALPAEFCAKNPPPMYITLYYIVTRLPDTLRPVRDHFLSVCPTTLIVDLLEERLLAAEKSIAALGASRGDPRAPVFEGCSPSPLLPSVASAAAADLVGLESVAGAVEAAVEAAEGVGVAVGVVAGVGASVAAVEAVAAVAVGAEVAEVAAVEEAAAEEVGLVGVALRRGSAPVVEPSKMIAAAPATVTIEGLHGQLVTFPADSEALRGSQGWRSVGGDEDTDEESDSAEEEDDVAEDVGGNQQLPFEPVLVGGDAEAVNGYEQGDAGAGVGNMQADGRGANGNGQLVTGGASGNAQAFAGGSDGNVELSAGATAGNAQAVTGAPAARNVVPTRGHRSARNVTCQKTQQQIEKERDELQQQVSELRDEIQAFRSGAREIDGPDDVDDPRINIDKLPKVEGKIHIPTSLSNDEAFANNALAVYVMMITAEPAKSMQFYPDCWFL
ncbi:unnamed protein product [Closterium sp. NIES-65]|nr:unnamed protein product [Closterium sp. NIES-65]